MKKYNIGILAHVDAGKTTITEKMLLACGVIRKSGSVDDGTTMSDFMEVEKRRGISVNSSCVSMNFRDAEIHLIDTPGHMDFSGEVYRSYAALDGVVLVLSGGEEIPAQAVTIFRTLRKLEIPAVIAVNKTDLPGFARDSFLLQVERELSGAYFCTDEAEAEWLPCLAEIDEELEEAYLTEETVPADKLREKARTYVASGRIYPVCFLCAKEGKGIPELLSTITEFLPDAASCEVPELSGVVFQIRHDPVMGKVAFVRLFGGELKARDEIGENKISQIRRILGAHFADVGQMGAGDIAAVYGLNDAKIGTVIGKSSPAIDARNRIAKAEPLLYVQADPENAQDEIALAEALTVLSEEDPLLRYERNPLTGQMFVHIMGEIQVEILTELLETRFSLKVRFSKPRIVYKETAGRPAEGLEVYTMPKPCWAIVKLLVEPLPRGSGVQFESVIKEGTLPGRYQNHVHDSVYQTIEQGIYGWEVTDCKFTLIDGQSHHVHTHPLDFFVATPVAVLRALENSGGVLLEPYMKVSLSAEDTLLGKVTGQILKMRGTFDTPEMRDGKFYMTAEMPLKDCMDYPTVFRSLTSGKGQISMELSAYRPCEPGTEETLPRKGVDPRDHAKWILACRSAVS